MVGDRRQGVGRRRHGRLLGLGDGPHRVGRARSAATGSPGRDGGQGAALRHPVGRRSSPPPTTVTSTGAVNSMHDSTRRSAAGWRCQHDARRGRPRRRRLRPLRHARAGHHHGVHRRPDGRAAPRSTSARRSAGGDQARRAVHPRHADARARWSPGSSLVLPGRRGTPILDHRAARASEVLYAFTSASNNNGSAFAGLTGEQPCLNIALGRRDAARPVRADRARARARRLPRPQQPVAPPPPAPCPPTRPLFVGLLVGVIRDRRRAHLLPRPRAGPLAEGLS